MTKSTRRVALGEDRRRRCRGRPRARCARPAATPPSGRAPGRSPRRPGAARRPRRRSCACAARAAPGRRGAARRRACAARSAQHLLGPHVVVRRATRPAPRSRRGDQRRTGRRSRPRRRTSTCRASPTGRRERRRPLEAGHDERSASPVGGHHQAGQPLQRQRVVAGEVAQVRAGRDAAGRRSRRRRRPSAAV